MIGDCPVKRVKIQLLLCVIVIVAVFFMVVIKNYDNIDEGFTYTMAAESDDSVVITGYTGMPKKMAVPERIDGYKVIAIGENAFAELKTLKSVKLPEGLESIGKRAFSGCTSLYKITLPSTVRQIGESAFAGCSLLKKARMPETLEIIADGAFEDCSSLEYVNIPASVSYIGADAFMHCSTIALDCEENGYAKQYAIDNNIPTDPDDSNSGTMKTLFAVVCISFSFVVALIIVVNRFVLKKKKGEAR